MHTILTLTKSSIKMFLRNRQALFFTLFTPLIIMGIFGLIGFDRPQKINVGLVKNSPNTQTQGLIEQLKQVPSFNITEGSEEQETKALEEDNRAAVFFIPDNLISENFSEEGTKTVTALLNASSQGQGQIAVSILNEILNKTSLELASAPDFFSISSRQINTNNLSYIDFLLPGIVALAIMQMSVFSVAFVFVDYKEKGILKRVLATPIQPYQFVSANVITRLLISVGQAVVLIAVGVLLLKAKVIGSYPLILLVTLLGATMFLGLGFTISGFAKTIETVPAVANLVVFPMLFLGGTFFPLDSMPVWLQNIAKFLPLTYFSDSLRRVMTENASLADIRTNLLFMLAWSVALVLLANYTFKFENKRN